MTSYKGRPSSIPTAKPFEAFFWITPERKDENSSEFSSAIVDWHYPEDITSITKEFRDIQQFCFPDLETIKIERTDKAKSEHFTFTLTDGDGARVYGICLRVFEGGVGCRYDVLRRPRHCLCFITKYPFFSMLRVALVTLHSMRLLMQDCELDFLAAIYNKRVSLAGDIITIPPDVNKGRYREFQLMACAKGGSSHSDVPIAPLVEILGIERFLLILSAALCERRIIFIATDVEKLSTSVHAAAAMLYPFQWQHIFIPLLPSKLLSYAAAPVPYMIGVRRYLLPMLAKEAMEDVIIVDCDSGECTMHGSISVRNIIGDAGNARKQASESFDRVKAEFNKYLLSNRADSDAATAAAANTTNRDVVACILADLKSALARRPSGTTSSVQMSLIRLGRSAADTSKDRWSAEFEVTIRESLMLFFVSLFGDMHDMMRLPASNTAQARGVAKSGEAFGQGDWRAALDVHAFLQRRIQLGTSKDLLDLISDMMHSQLFEKFCEERLRRKNQGKLPEEDAELDIFDRVCFELSNRQLQPTVNNIKNALDAIRKADSAKVDDVAADAAPDSSPKDVATRDSYQSKRSGDNLEQFHQLTLKLTSNSTKDSTGDIEEWTSKICSDAWRSDNFERIFRTVWLRLEDCKQFNWRHGLKGLLLLRSLLLLGPEAVLSNSLDHIPLLQSLTIYKSNSSSEVRESIRSKAKEVLCLVLDQGLLSLQRKFWAAHRLGSHKFYNLQQHLQEQLKRDLQASGNASFHPQSPNQLPHFRDIHMGFKPSDAVLQSRPVSLPVSRPPSTSSAPPPRGSSVPRRVQQQVMADLLDFDFDSGGAVDAPAVQQDTVDPWSAGFGVETPKSQSSVNASAVNPFDAAAASNGFDSFGDETPASKSDGFDDGFGSDPFSSSPQPSSVPPPTKPPKPAARTAPKSTGFDEPFINASDPFTFSKSHSNDGFDASIDCCSDPFVTRTDPATVPPCAISRDGFEDSFGSDACGALSASERKKPSDGFDSFGSGVDPFSAASSFALSSAADNVSTPAPAAAKANSEAAKQQQEDPFSRDPFATVTPVATPQKPSRVTSDGFGDSFSSSDPFAPSSATIIKAHSTSDATVSSSASRIVASASSNDGFGDSLGSSDPFAAPVVQTTVPAAVTNAKTAAPPMASASASRSSASAFSDPFAAPVKSSDGFGDSFGSSDPFVSARTAPTDPFSVPFGTASSDPFVSARTAPTAAVDPFSVPFGTASSDPFAVHSKQQSFDPFASTSGDPFASTSTTASAGFASDPFGLSAPAATPVVPAVAMKSNDPFGDAFGSSQSVRSAEPFAYSPQQSYASSSIPAIRTQMPPVAVPSYGSKKASDPFADISQSWMKNKK